MDPHTVIEEWDSRQFTGGYGELADLAAQGFSGAVEAAGSWIFLSRGDPIAVIDGLDVNATPGTIDTFEASTGTAYEAPHGGIPTLLSMLCLEGDVRGKYYTDDTPLSKVHETLTGGGFTGYIELSESVLSGDYYVVYVDGTAEYIATLSAGDRVIVGEEAETKAKSEVGLYEVIALSLPTIEIPDQAPEEPENNETVDKAATESTDSAPAEQEEQEDSATGPKSVDHSQDDSDPIAEAETHASEGSADGQSLAASVSPSDSSLEDESDSVRETAASGTTSTGTATGISNMTEHIVPSLDPANTGAQLVQKPPEPAEPEGQSRETETTETQPIDSEAQAPNEELLESIRAEYETKLEEIQSQLAEIRSERNQLKDQLDDLQAQSQTVGDSTTPATTSISEPRAIAETNLFIRERSRGEPTLEDVHSGDVEKAAVVENLRIEHHTEFDDEQTTVNGRPFSEYLEDSLHYRFAHWLIAELMFEIRSTDTHRKLNDLYAALPHIDRIGFREEIEHPEADTAFAFDVVGRDRLGNPLLVATLDQNREATEAGALQPFIEDVTEIVSAHETLTAGFSVTESYFEPPALEVAREATSGSLLSRDKRLSYVKLSRSSGFHLCLVEARDGSFHLTVPEL